MPNRHLLVQSMVKRSVMSIWPLVHGKVTSIAVEDMEVYVAVHVAIQVAIYY